MGSSPIVGSCPGGELSYSGGIVLVMSCPGGEQSYSGELSWWGAVL